MGVKRMLRYIKRILGYGLKFSVTKSTTEAEYVLSQATQEAIYLRKLFADLCCKADSPTVKTIKVP